MNIFYLHNCARLSAEMLTDVHTNKMLIESAQLLSTAIQLTICERDPELYVPAYEHHPCVQWTMDSADNAWWLYSHYDALFFKFQRMYRKDSDKPPHQAWRFSVRIREWLTAGIFPASLMTPPPRCMPEEYQIGAGDTFASVVESYRAYYLGDKITAISYRKQKPPYWVPPPKIRPQIIQHPSSTPQFQDPDEL